MDGEDQEEAEENTQVPLTPPAAHGGHDLCHEKLHRLA